MKVYIEKDDCKKKIRFKGTLRELLKKLKINPAAVFVVKNKKNISNDEKLSNSDSVSILEVFMGG